MKKHFGGIILDVSTRLIIPFSIMYAIYVLAAGEYGPGGGFQAGAVLALGILCARLIRGKSAAAHFGGASTVAYAGLGTFLYCLMGWLTLFGEGKFLEYGKLPFPWMDYDKLHETGIFLIETGVTICVMMTIISILEALLQREGYREDD